MNPSASQRARVPKEKNSRFAKEQAWVESVSQIRQGNSQALSDLYDEASPLVFSIALRILDNRADAEEVTVDVFTQVWKNAGTWSSERGSVTSWLVLLARSRALDKLRWRRSRTRLEEPSEILEFSGPALASGEVAAAAAEHRERVQFAMKALNDAQRRALDLAFFAGLTHQEIAERLNEPLGTIKSRIRSAMLKMKEVMST